MSVTRIFFCILKFRPPLARPKALILVVSSEPITLRSATTSEVALMAAPRASMEELSRPDWPPWRA